MTKAFEEFLRLRRENDPVEILISKFSSEIMRRGIGALVADGASPDRAATSWNEIARQSAVYVFLGPFKAAPDSQTRADIAAVASAAARLDKAIREMNPTAIARLQVYLQPDTRRGLFGRLGGYRRPSGNPDPILADDQTPSLGGFGDMAILAPADMAAKFNRLAFDLTILKPLLTQAARFRAKQGRPANWQVRRLFEGAIREWTEATGQPPSAAQVDGAATSPFLGCLRELVCCAVDDQDVREALSDAVYLDVLSQLKRKTHGLISTLGLIPRRRRTKTNKTSG